MRRLSRTAIGLALPFFLLALAACDVDEASNPVPIDAGSSDAAKEADAPHDAAPKD
jgi:hypothetical protein